MPRIPKSAIESVFFLYASRQDAEEGKNPGGTGFIVTYRGKFDREGFNFYHFALTNWHVACRGFPVIRLNAEDGGCEVFDFGPEDWEFLPGGVDVAALAIDLPGRERSLIGIWADDFLTERGRDSVGVGDDVFMLGLFVDHAGTTTNQPKARFGNISMMASDKAPIMQPTGHLGESYIIDMHSRTGFSGSPVFVYRTPLTDFAQRRNVLRGTLDLAAVDRQIVDSQNSFGRRQGVLSKIPSQVNIQIAVSGTLFALLGIHWGQFPEKWEIDVSDIEESRRSYAQATSGMTCVIPSWRIMEVLEIPKFKETRMKNLSTGE